MPFVPKGGTAHNCRYRPGQVVRHFSKHGVIQSCDFHFRGVDRDLSCFARGGMQPFYTVITDRGRRESPEDTRYVPEEEIEVMSAEALRHSGSSGGVVRHSELAVHFHGFDEAKGEFRPWKVSDALHFPAADSTSFLAAAALSITWITASRTILDGGFDATLQTLAAQAHGARNATLMQTWLKISLALTTLACVPIALSWAYAGSIVRGALGVGGCDDVCVKLVRTYSRISIAWLWPSAVYSQLNTFLQTRAVVIPQLVISAAGVGVNVLLNWLFIYRAGMGFAGSPLATTATRVLLLLSLVCWWAISGGRGWGWGVGGDNDTKDAVASVSGERDQCERVDGDRGGDRDGGCATGGCASGSGAVGAAAGQAAQTIRARTWEFLRLCGPLGVGNALEEWQVQLVGFFAGALGETAVATHNGMLQVFFVLTALQWGMLKATQVRVGHNLGRGCGRMARRVGAFALFVAVGVGIGIAVVLVVSRQVVGRLFSDSAAVVHKTAEICAIVGAGYAFLSVFFVSVATLSAQGRGTAVAVSFLVGAWGVSVPVSYALALRTSLGLVGLWLGLSAGYAVITVLAGWAVARSDWAALTEEAVRRSAAQQRQRRQPDATASSIAAADEGDESDERHDSAGSGATVPLLPRP
eukprot:g2287.t1